MIELLHIISCHTISIYTIAFFYTSQYFQRFTMIVAIANHGIIFQSRHCFQAWVWNYNEK